MKKISKAKRKAKREAAKKLQLIKSRACNSLYMTVEPVIQETIKVHSPKQVIIGCVGSGNASPLLHALGRELKMQGYVVGFPYEDDILEVIADRMDKEVLV